MNHYERTELEGLSTFKWQNPNKFNATNAAIAFLVAIVGFNLLSLVISPIMKLMIDSGVGMGIALCFSAVISQLFIFGLAYIFCKIKKVAIFGGADLRLRFTFAPCLPALLLSVGTLLLIMPSHNYFAEKLGEVQKALFGGSTLDYLADIKITDAFAILFYAFVLAPILPAIAEEALFRGVIMSGLREFGNFFAIILSGALFALMHGNYSQLILQFILGCEIAFVVIVNENYLLGIVMHFMNNLFAVLFGVFTTIALEMSPVLGNFLEGISVFLGLIMVCVAICYYFRLIKYKSTPSLYRTRRFAFYKPDVKKRPCCLLGKGDLLSNRFVVDNRVVVVNDNSNFLFFAGRKFHKFTKRSNKVVFAITLSVALLLAVGLIVLSFILVG